MMQLSSGILGGLAAVLAFGAVHLEVASGNDLFGPRHAASPTLVNPVKADEMVDRAGKGDRLAGAQDTASNSLTFAFKVPGNDSSSVLMRVPVADLVKKIPAPRHDSEITTARRMVACEPSVSVLAPIARQLGPARCVT